MEPQAIALASTPQVTPSLDQLDLVKAAFDYQLIDVAGSNGWGRGGGSWCCLVVVLGSTSPGLTCLVVVVLLVVIVACFLVAVGEPNRQHTD